MKRIACLLMLIFLANAAGAFADDPGYPPVIDGLDFGGRTVYIYDWFSYDDEQHAGRRSDPGEDTQKRYDYVDWLEETYHCTIVETTLSDWAGNPEKLTNMVLNRDDSRLCIVAIAGDFISYALNNDLYMPWTVDLTGDQWNPSDAGLMTKDGILYGVHPGKAEPRQCIFFNRRVLQDAGIDPEIIYDSQANGEWTWAMMEDLMDRIQRDAGYDGVQERYALVGGGDDLALGLVYSNNARFFDFDPDGTLVIAADRKEALDALDRWKQWMETYMVPQPEGTRWDWYKEYWNMGTVAFYAAQTWQGFNDNSEIARLDDDWGCVMFPKGPNADACLAAACDNIYGIPAVYDGETSEKLQQLFALYCLDTPGVDPGDAWIGDKYAYTDERAVDETYAMMREPDHSALNYTYLLGSTNDVICDLLLWGPLERMAAAEAAEAVRPAWQEMLDLYNGR